MAWVKIDDQLHAHPKVRRAWRASPRALGLHLLALSYCGQYLSDGFVDEDFVEERLPRRAERADALKALVDAGLWDVADGGWQIHDFLEYNRSRAETEETRAWDNKRKALFRDVELLDAIRARDADHCRYCGRKVNWKDRRSSAGGTYDHVEPRGDNTFENVVIACRGCNSKKGSRTLSASGMELIPTQNGSRPDLVRSLN